MQNFNGLLPAETERLALLLEELGEAQHAIGKILRHGYESYHPDFPEKTNRQNLEKELGHIDLACQLMFKEGDILRTQVTDYRRDKELSIEDYFHHQRTLRMSLAPDHGCKFCSHLAYCVCDD